ncbi:hypothetical protein [Nocardia sp. NBC_00403]
MPAPLDTANLLEHEGFVSDDIDHVFGEYNGEQGEKLIIRTDGPRT